VSEGNNPEVLAERSIFGEANPDAASLNLRGKLYQHYDGAGVVTSERYDFKGNLLRGSRRLAVEYKQQVDWVPLATLTDAQVIASPSDALLEAETFTTSTEYDALNRPTRLTTPDKSQISPTYNEANLLERVEAKLRGADETTPFVTGLVYDAKGQRIQIDYGNAATTNYEYDEKTFRLTRLRTTRESDDAKLQDLSYTYDPVGNITAIRDDAQQTIYFNNQVVTASAEYEYDATYRLLNAAGREHLGQTGGQPNAPRQPDHDDSFWTNLPHPGDGQAMGNYTERYEYDEVGNILKMIHAAVTGSWTRNYQYDPGSNRLLLTSNPSGSMTDKYDHDAHGNMIRMPHLPLMQWDFKDQLHATSRQVVNNGGTPETTWYVYDSGGQRVRKVTERQAASAQTITRKAERIYLGGFEIYREYENDGATLKLERETLHIMDDKQRIALVETKTQDVEVTANTLPETLIRYQLGNHLGSASLELDSQGQIISYEEYTPYGSTLYQAVRSQSEATKRYRYTSKERDEESELYYHGARYYVSWLGRWSTPDPAGLVDGSCLYKYGRNNPVIFSDPWGLQSEAGSSTGSQEEVKTEEALDFNEQYNAAIDFVFSEFFKKSFPEFEQPGYEKEREELLQQFTDKEIQEVSWRRLEKQTLTQYKDYKKLQSLLKLDQGDATRNVTEIRTLIPKIENEELRVLAYGLSLFMEGNRKYGVVEKQFDPEGPQPNAALKETDDPCRPNILVNAGLDAADKKLVLLSALISGTVGDIRDDQDADFGFISAQMLNSFNRLLGKWQQDYSGTAGGENQKTLEEFPTRELPPEVRYRSGITLDSTRHFGGTYTYDFYKNFLRKDH
jgi:RHS repeat-associated protein